MPPPTAADSWLNSRRFGLVIDAGSSGSRLQIYSWRDARAVRDELGREVFYSLPKVEKGTQDAEDWVSKVEPGISSFASHPEGVASYLAPLLDHAQKNIPPSLHSETPLFLLATAGMRLLSPEQQATVLQSTCHFLKFHSNFRIDDPSPAGPCGSSVRIITGEEEGLFGWIAVNYLMDGFGPSDTDRTTYGFLDMGGASTQIAFEPSKEEREKAQNLIDVRLRLMGGEEIHHQVFVTTWLGYGTNQARERYVGHAINDYEQLRIGSSSDNGEVVDDPCLPKDLRLVESPVHMGSSTSHTRKPHILQGSGSFGQCLERVSPLLNKSAPCQVSPCLFNGVHVPPIDFSVSHFIGVSEYWYSSEHIFGLGGAYDFVQYEQAASKFCGKNWAEILRMHEKSKQRGRLGGDGQIEKGGQVVGLDKWGDKVEVSRLEMQCFKAAWVVNVLHEGLGMPRIVDPGGNITTHPEDIENHAKQKGLGPPTFQSMDSVGDIAISWTLGKMVLEASKEVPPLYHDNHPLVDPLDDISNADNSPIQPIRSPFQFDFDAIEDHISSHLPSSLTRQSLGFSFIGFMFYLVVSISICLVIWRLRHYIRMCARRFLGSSPKRDQDLAAVSLEEGNYLIGNSVVSSSPRPTSTPASRRWLRSFRRAASFWHMRPPQIIHLQKPHLRASHPSPNVISPTRSLSYPSFHHSNPNVYKPTSASASISPTVGPFDDNAFKINGEVGGTSATSIYSRSRNSSTISLSTLVPRQPISRTPSGLQVPSGTPFLDE
ncbi:hypothetical protein EW146_g558 [Bondarzewia mesenterica]|uniref:Golgi apyrase n=1 Tax=Bondarzewia mesenterica TaxID=1095465 RepID=A0A4S4M6V0_9AGAM|nr:hypothetical protein EW146_g558 [Bondarzewia mesenterica]